MEMLKYICTGFAVVMGLIAVLMPAMAVYAADPPAIVATVNINGNNPNANVNLNGNNPSVWINGYGLGDLSYYAGYQGGAMAAAAGNGFSAPNGQYSSSSTGLLPLPNITPDGRVADVGSAGTQWVAGWKGYFCPDTNEDISVYKGGGCGGTWGVCDGSPDMWSRRQIAGLAPEFRQQQNKLETSIAAISRLIMETRQHGTDMQYTQTALQQNLEQLGELSMSLAMLERRHDALEEMVAQQKDESDRRFTLVCIVFGIGMLGMLGYLVMNVLRDRPRLVDVKKPEWVKKPDWVKLPEIMVHR
jgi:hypothetical protein